MYDLGIDPVVLERGRRKLAPMPHTLLLLLCLVLQKQPAANKQGAQEQVKKPSVDHPAPETRPANSEVVVKQARPVDSPVSSNDHKEQNRAQTVKEINDTLLVIFTGALAVVGGLQWWTLRNHGIWIERSTLIARDAADAAKKSADAALLNAQAIINSERPWVIIFVKQGSDLELTFAAGNMGKTPGEIVSYSKVQVFCDSPDNLSVPPQYGADHIPAVKLLVPSSGKPDGTELDMLVHAPPRIWEKGGSRVGWDHKEQACVFYFRVIYRDFISKAANLPNYETRMCFWYTPEKLDPIVGGPQEYNQHT